MLSLSIIVPVYNRPNEVEELLASLVEQTDKDFEAVIVEYGSRDTFDDICKRYDQRHDPKYFHQDTSGQGLSRNH